MPSGAPDAQPVAELLRDLVPHVLGALVRRFGQFDSCEDAVQEALLEALAAWPRDGVPQSPKGWLLTAASRRMIDEIRSDSARRRREAEYVAAGSRLTAPDLAATPEVTTGRDDGLALLFMCCHPALSAPSQIALTLRAVGGLTTAQIAAAFLVPVPTMAQRISRAKQAVQASGGRFEMPGPGERMARLAIVLHVLYLIFNEGYTATTGADLTAPELSAEAIRLTRWLHGLLPDDSEVGGLLALMLLTDARRAARTTADGSLVPLDKQDRAAWDTQRIAEGVALISAILPAGQPGPYQVQAAIAAVHDEADSVATTDWAEVLGLYDVLERLAPGPVVTLNRAVAVAMVAGPAAGLDLIRQLDASGQLQGHHRLYSTRAHLQEMSGDRTGAVASYRDAASRATSGPERRYLLSQAARLSERKESPGPM